MASKNELVTCHEIDCGMKPSSDDLERESKLNRNRMTAIRAIEVNFAAIRWSFGFHSR